MGSLIFVLTDSYLITTNNPTVWFLFGVFITHSINYLTKELFMFLPSATITKFKSVYNNTAIDNNHVAGTYNYMFNRYLSDLENLLHVEEAIKDLCESNESINLLSAIPQLANRIPHIAKDYCNGSYKQAYYIRKATLNIAATLLHMCIDAETIVSNKKVKKVNGKYTTETILMCEGIVEKVLFGGMHDQEGIATQRKLKGIPLQIADTHRLRRLSSIPFKISNAYTPELVAHGYKLKKDWNVTKSSTGGKLQEDRILKQRRYAKYNEAIQALANVDYPLYLEMEYSGSGRMYYLFQLEGARPQGKLWETQMIDSYEGYYLDKVGIRALKHQIYVHLVGKVSIEHIDEVFTDELLNKALSMKPLEVEIPPKGSDEKVYRDAEEEFGKRILLRKAAYALTHLNEPCHYLFGWDFTNSGLMMASLGFKSTGMASKCNLIAGEDVKDPYMQFVNAFKLDITRNDAKSLLTPLLHGSTIGNLTATLNMLLPNESLTDDDVLIRLAKAFGKEIVNIPAIAEYGIRAVDDETSRITFKTLDGFTAIHKAYFQSCPIKLMALSDKGITTHGIYEDMPYCKTSTGKPLVERHTETFVSTAGSYEKQRAVAKTRGLYATITHSCDAYVLRHVSDSIMDHDMPVLLKHDDYMIHPNMYEDVLDWCKEAFLDLEKASTYQSVLKQINNKTPHKGVPTLVTGDYTLDSSTTNFLMP